MSYLTPEELAACQALDRGTPYVITNVSHTQLSVARHYGGITYQGRRYIYVPPSDELVRWDVLRLVGKLRTLQRKKARTEAKEKQGELSFFG